MHLALDIGNTATKWALFEEGHVADSGLAADLQSLPQAEHCTSAMACISGNADGLPESILRLSHLTPLPIRSTYLSPQTLGADRVAAACGAWRRHQACPSLIIDAGTCITADFLDAEGIYHGGAIMPGLDMSLAALHEHTHRLPLVSLEGVEKAPILGRSTEECILAGTLGATMTALAGFIAIYKGRCPNLQVLLTGGDAERLIAAGATAWEYAPLLTLEGIDAILSFNEENKKEEI